MSVRSLNSKVSDVKLERLAGKSQPFTWGRLWLIVAVILVLPSLIGQGGLTKRGFDSEPVKKLRKSQPHCVFVGDSMLETRIDASWLSSLSKIRSEVLAYPGTGTAQWFLILKNYVAVLPQNPACAVFFFRDRQLTIPAYHTTGRYRRRTEALMNRVETVFERVLLNARRNPALLSKVAKKLYPIQRVREEFQEKVLGMALDLSSNHAEARSVRDAAWKMFQVKNLRDDNNGGAEADDESMTGLNPTGHEFYSEVDESFLPEILSLARSKNIRLVFFRVKRRPSAKTIVPDPTLQKYMAELEGYLARNGAKLVDESNDPSVTVDYYTTDDHVSQARMRAYTERFWSKQGSVIEQLVQPPATGKAL